MSIEFKSQNIRSFGRVRGRKLRTHASELYEELLPKLSVVMPAQAGIHALTSTTTYLEIGFGSGEHLAHVAALHPNVSFIGCEPFVNGITKLLKSIEENDTQNIRIFTDDVRLLLDAMPNACLDRVYILYPDPWPKARHHKRRLIQTALLDKLERVMKPGAELRIATDWDDYATWILEQVLPHSAFEWQAEKATDWAQPWDEWIPTRYEQKARREGRGTSYFRFMRR